MSNEFILNIGTGILHTKSCADGETGLPPVAAGKRKHYSSYENAIEDPRYVKDHNNSHCLG